MSAGASLPKELAGLRVQRVSPREDIDEIDSIFGGALTLNRFDGRSSASTGVGMKGPINASSLRIERVNVTCIAAEENAARDDGRLGMHFRCFRHAKRPFEFQLGNLSGRQTGRARRLESRILVAGTPAVPGGTARGIRHRWIGGAGIRHLLEIARF